MDTFLSVLTLLTLAVSINDGVGAFSVLGYCGGSVSVKCEYDSKYGGRSKSFCQGEKGHCRELIRTNIKNKWFFKDRYSLLDNKTHYFVVKISDLAVADAGRYHCGIRGEEETLLSEVNLEVKNDLFTCGQTLVRTVYLGDSMNVTCPYLSTHAPAAKYLCKAFRNRGCNYRAFTAEDRTWVHSDRISLYDDREKRVFSAVLREVGQLDSGSYWCGVETGWELGGDDGYKALVQRVQLTVSDTQPTPPVTLEPATPPQTTEITGPTTTPTKLLPTSIEPSTTQSQETSPQQTIHTETDTTTSARGQGSAMADPVLFSTAVPIIEGSSNLWLMIICAIAALIAIVILSALLLYIISRRRRAKAKDSSPYLVSMDALWSSPLLPREPEPPLATSDSDPTEPEAFLTNSAAEPNSTQLTPPESNPPELTTAESNASEVIQTGSN